MTDIGSAITEAASLDPAIRDRVIALANMALSEAEYLMQYGDPTTRVNLIRGFTMTFAKHLRAQETHNEVEELKREMQGIKEAMLGRVPGQTLIEIPANDAVEDIPPQ